MVFTVFMVFDCVLWFFMGFKVVFIGLLMLSSQILFFRIWAPWTWSPPTPIPSPKQVFIRHTHSSPPHTTPVAHTIQPTLSLLTHLVHSTTFLQLSTPLHHLPISFLHFQLSIKALEFHFQVENLNLQPEECRAQTLKSTASFSYH